MDIQNDVSMLSFESNEPHHQNPAAEQTASKTCNGSVRQEHDPYVPNIVGYLGDHPVFAPGAVLYYPPQYQIPERRKNFLIVIKMLTRPSTTWEVTPQTTIAHLKSAVQDTEGIPARSQTLRFAHWLLENGTRLADVSRSCFRTPTFAEISGRE